MTVDAGVYPTDISHNRTVLVKEDESFPAFYLYANNSRMWGRNDPRGCGLISGWPQPVYGGTTLAKNHWSHLVVT
jgi:hypothetical protein